MKDFLLKNFSIRTLALLLVGFSLFGLIKYVDYRFVLVEKQVEETEKLNEANNQKLTLLEQNYKNFNDVISGAKSNLDNALQQTQDKNNYLENQFNEINNTVGALSKLATTDPELLKKYSKVYFLNEHYAPISLSDIDKKYLSSKSVNFQILSDVLPHLESMMEASVADGVSLEALSAYRSFPAQATLKSSYTVLYGIGTANTFSADQGYSEHQLGTAIDFTTLKLNGALTGFDKTPEYQWLKDNGYKYGFVISYPSGNQYYKFEPWHWRFVGIALATRLRDENKYFYDLDQRVIDSYLANIFD